MPVVFLQKWSGNDPVFEVCFHSCVRLAAIGGQAEEDVAVVLQEYVDFATYEQGIILPEQIDQTVFNSAIFIDARDAAQFEERHIPGAINIEWRELPYRMDEVPESGMVIFYCNTGTISSQTMFMSRLMGRENTLVLQTGQRGWLVNGAYHP